MKLPEFFKEQNKLFLLGWKKEARLGRREHRQTTREQRPPRRRTARPPGRSSSYPTFRRTPQVRVFFLFECPFTSFFKKKAQNSRNQGFSYYFCLVIEWAGSGSISLTNGAGSGSRRPKNIRIRRIRIRKKHWLQGKLSWVCSSESCHEALWPHCAVCLVVYVFRRLKQVVENFCYIFALFRFRDIIWWIRIRILVFEHWITNPYPAFLTVAFKDSHISTLISKFDCFLLSVGTFALVFESLKITSHKTIEIKIFLSFLPVDGRIHICTNN